MTEPTVVDVSHLIEKPDTRNDIRVVFGAPSKEDLLWLNHLSFRMLFVVYHTQTGAGSKGGVQQLMRGIDRFIEVYKHKYGISELKTRISVYFAPLKLTDRDKFRNHLLEMLDAAADGSNTWVAPAGVSRGLINPTESIAVEGSYVNRLRDGD